MPSSLEKAHARAVSTILDRQRFSSIRREEGGRTRRRARIVIPANSIPLGHILNLVIFTLALLVILYLNLPYFSPAASSQRYDWARIRYQSPNPPPPAHGRCPGVESTTKPVLVVARISSDSVGWTERLKEKYHLCVYTSDAPRSSSSSSSSSTTTPVLQTPANRAHEALPYLTFIIDNYASLLVKKTTKTTKTKKGYGSDDAGDSGVVFVHGSRFAWHNDHPAYDGLALLQALNVSRALATSGGYANLKCDWAASTCPTYRSSGVEPQAAWSNTARSVIEPWNTKVISDAKIANSLVQIFGRRGVNPRSGPSTIAPAKLSRSDILRSQCCAQFVVARSNIAQHTRDEYVALRQWLLDESSSAAHPDDRVAGRIMSYLWHILFLPRDQVVFSGGGGGGGTTAGGGGGGGTTAGGGGGGAGGADGEKGREVKEEEGQEQQLLSLAKLNTLACPSARDCYCRLYGRCELTACREDGSRCDDGLYRLPPGFRLPKYIDDDDYDENDQQQQQRPES